MDSLLIGKRVKLFDRDLSDMPPFVAFDSDDKVRINDAYERRCKRVPMGKEGTVLHICVHPALGERLIVQMEDGSLRSFRLEDVEV